MPRLTLTRLFVCFFVTTTLVLVINTHQHSVVAQETSPDAGQQAVEDDMHEFMEYMFQPTYLRLKSSMAAEPNNEGWKAIKSDSLILAEGANLLLTRVSEEDPKAWTTISQEVRSHGSQLYVAGKKKDFAGAKKHYEAMIKSCNACHTTFAGGEYQLRP